jgi:hypothetical protein
MSPARSSARPSPATRLAGLQGRRSSSSSAHDPHSKESSTRPTDRRRGLAYDLTDLCRTHLIRGTVGAISTRALRIADRRWLPNR